jgi:4,5-dihydroxyphthalate decarboxylase
MNEHPFRLSTLLGTYPNTVALKEGRVRSPRIALDFADIEVPNQGFKPLVREAKFDLSEIAIVTYLQAKIYGKPYVLIPAVLLARGQHHTIAYNPGRGTLAPGDLNGRRVGVRSYTVTTGAWVRGFLADDYGVELDSIRWITFEEPHVAEYRDPPNVERAPAGKALVQMLLDGEIDAAIVGDAMPDARLAHLVPDADAEARRWAQAHGGVPINHMPAIRTEIARDRPDVVREVFDLFLASKHAASLPTSGTALDPYRFGVETMRRTLDIIIEYCVQQRLIAQRISVDALFDDVTRLLAA